MHTIGGVEKNMESKVFVLDQTTIKKLLTIYKLAIPDFQRNFVWKNSKKEQLLASLFRGFPIGAITLYDDKNTYYIIDGLQRINTLNQYLSRPATIITFRDFFKKVSAELEIFIKNKELAVTLIQLKKCIKKWYENLKQLYEFEKVSVLYSSLKNENQKIRSEFEDLEIVEELLDILKSKIEIVYDDIALIIYKGDKNDLPDLFKNINTGSVALSQYEILQSVWQNYTLDKQFISDTNEAFNRELELIRKDYEIDAIKESGIFDIFKNIIGLNHIICCQSECDIIFKFSGFKKLADSEIIDFGNQIKKYYDNDSIAFEIYSTILCHSSNQIVKAVDSIFKHNNNEEISKFINQVNKIIIEAVDIAIKELKKQTTEIFESKYHSLYILAGIIFSEYDINANNLTINKSVRNSRVYHACLDIENHVKNKWFIDENRQMGFFNIKIEELAGMKQEDYEQKENQSGILKIQIDNKIISADTVKGFYRKIFDYLVQLQVDLNDKIPYATGKKRYLVNWTDHHINGDLFVSPIKVGDYYVETHKSKAGATKDIFNFLKNIGVNANYVD